jgi:hypothetical protein
VDGNYESGFDGTRCRFVPSYFADPNCKSSLIKYDESDKIFVHEYGHTGVTRTSYNESYTWPTANFLEYGDWDNPDTRLREPAYSGLNLMHYDDTLGPDADRNYKPVSFPFYYYFPWDSYCWDDQW